MWHYLFFFVSRRRKEQVTYETHVIQHFITIAIRKTCSRKYHIQRAFYASNRKKCMPVPLGYRILRLQLRINNKLTATDCVDLHLYGTRDLYTNTNHLYDRTKMPIFVLCGWKSKYVRGYAKIVKITLSILYFKRKRLCIREMLRNYV